MSLTQGLTSLDALLAHPQLAQARSLRLGVACSAFQTEGGFNVAGAPATHWGAWERSGRVEPSGGGADLWNRFPEALARCQSMGLTSFRMSVEWARLSAGSEGLDADVLDAYTDRIAGFVRAGITPNVTLLHFTHPAWLGEDFWLQPDAPARFARYADRVVTGISRRLVARGLAPLHRLITLNEPNMLAMADYLAGIFPHAAPSLAEGSIDGLSRCRRALDHLLTAHVLAWRALHARYDAEGWPRPDVSFNPNFIDVYALSKGLFDLLRAPSLGTPRRGVAAFLRSATAQFMTDFYGDEARSTRAEVARWVNERAPVFFGADAFTRTLEVLYERPHERPFDHLAVDLYDPHTLQMLPAGDVVLLALVRGRPLPPLTSLAGEMRIAEPWEWQAESHTMIRMLHALSWPHPRVPVDIAENGMALRREPGALTLPRADGVTRPMFFRAYLRALVEARVVHDLPVRAWHAWTLVDNYELGRWAPRFGLHGLGDPSTEGAVAPWQDTDAAGDDAAGTIGAVARALTAQDVGSLRIRLGEALGATPAG